MVLTMLRKQVVCFILAVVFIAGSVGLVRAADENVHVVQRGDTLWRIAIAHDTTWEILAEYNNLENPHLIFPGQVIRIPALPQDEDYPAVWLYAEEVLDDILYRTHVVQVGESLSSIARAYYDGENIVEIIQAILDYNNMSADSLIFVGQKLLIPQLPLATPPFEIYTDGSNDGNEIIDDALYQRMQALQALVEDVDTSIFGPYTTLEDLEVYADIIRERFGLSATIRDRDTLWYLLDLLFDWDYWSDFEEIWQYFYEAGNPDILRYVMEVGPEVAPHELFVITLVYTAAGEPHGALAFLLDYIVTAMRAELAIIRSQLDIHY